jgi:hypothetical protein
MVKEFAEQLQSDPVQLWRRSRRSCTIHWLKKCRRTAEMPLAWNMCFGKRQTFKKADRQLQVAVQVQYTFITDFQLVPSISRGNLPRRSLAHAIFLYLYCICMCIVFVTVLVLYLLCVVCVLYYFCNFVCCVLLEWCVLFCVMCVILCDVSHCSTTSTGYKPICSQNK